MIDPKANNPIRIRNAAVALKKYRRIFKSPDGAVQNILADLRHYCSAENVDFDCAVGVSRKFFMEEA